MELRWKMLESRMHPPRVDPKGKAKTNQASISRAFVAEDYTPEPEADEGSGSVLPVGRDHEAVPVGKAERLAFQQQLVELADMLAEFGENCRQRVANPDTKPSDLDIYYDAGKAMHTAVDRIRRVARTYEGVFG